MATAPGPGPEREQYALKLWEADVFRVIVDMSTYSVPRLQLSNAFRMVAYVQGNYVQDGFQRNAQKMWR
jgi:hypothetical protein